MNRFLTTAITAIALAAASAMPLHAQRGEKTLGLKGGYATRNEAAVAGIFLQYRFSRHFLISPGIEFVFPHRHTDAFLFNINTHFPFRLENTGVEVYPIAGINYVSWNYHPVGSDDVTSRRMRFGFNAGLGLSYKVTPTMKLILEGRFNGVSRLSTGLIEAGIGYCF